MGLPEQNDKIKFKVEDDKVEYHESELFDLNTLGISGVITMDLKGPKDSARGGQRAIPD